MLHNAHRFRVSLRICHAVLPVEPLLEVASLLVADQRDRPPVELAEARDDGAVVRATPVAVQLDPVVEQAFDVVERVRAVGMRSRARRSARYRLPSQSPRCRAPSAASNALLLTGHPCPAKQWQARKPPEPLPQPKFGVTGQRVAGAAPSTRAARVAGRRRRDGRTADCARRDRTLRGASRGLSAGRPAGLRKRSAQPAPRS